jgi:hypothetical protein
MPAAVTRALILFGSSAEQEGKRVFRHPLVRTTHHPKLTP